MAERAVRGTLHAILRPGQPGAGEERLGFSSIEELMELCARHQGTAAFTRVELIGPAGGHTHRLVLDFGQFSAWPG